MRKPPLYGKEVYATAPDASAQPIVLPLREEIVLPLREENDAKELRRHLDGLLLERTWPGSL